MANKNVLNKNVNDILNLLGGIIIVAIVNYFKITDSFIYILCNIVGGLLIIKYIIIYKTKTNKFQPLLKSALNNLIMSIILIGTAIYKIKEIYVYRSYNIFSSIYDISIYIFIGIIGLYILKLSYNSYKRYVDKKKYTVSEKLFEFIKTCGYISLVSSLLILSMQILDNSSREKYYNEGIKDQGIVTDKYCKEDSNSSEKIRNDYNNEEYSCYIVVEYSGNTYTLSDGYINGENQYSLEIGDSIILYYFEEEPTKVIFEENIATKYISYVIGGVFFAFALLFLGTYYKYTKKSD